MALPGFKGVRMRTFASELGRELIRDAVTDTAAQLGYYLLFALFPFLFFLVTLTAYLPLGNAASELMSRLSAVMPPAAVKLVGTQLDALLHRPKPHLLTAGILVALYSASRAADAFRNALNLAYDVHESRPLWRSNLASLGFTVLAAVLGLAGIAMIVAGGNAGAWLAANLGVTREYLLVWGWLRWPCTALLVMFVAALGYYMLPDVEQKFRYITPGSVLATALWLFGTWGFTQYVNHFGHYEVAYGSLGGVIVLMTWLYISGLVFIFGGEVNAVIERLADGGKAVGAHRFGEAPPPPDQRPSISPPAAGKDARVAAQAHARSRSWRHWFARRQPQ